MQQLELKQDFRCKLCANNIASRHDITFCPRCMNGFHTEHLASWIYAQNTTCPACDSPLDELLVRELQPRSEMEKRKLAVLNYLYQPADENFEESNTGLIPKLRNLASIFVITLPGTNRRHNAA